MQETAPKIGAPPGRIAAALPLATAVLATIALAFPVLNPKLQLYYRDTARLYYPLKLYIAERLSHGQLALWDPWTECGVSLLGQISPGLLHPFTLLYLLLPFDFAFKVNHLLALPMAAAGTYWFSRKLGTAPWPSAVAGIIFSCSGYLISTTASNLPYAIGPASTSVACGGLLWLCERPSPKRLLLASGLLALCNYSGEPQSALFAGTIGGACALGLSLGKTMLVPARARFRQLGKTIGLVALWGALGLALSMPAVLPGGIRAHASDRWRGLNEEELALFSLHPVRLLGLAIPRAFDDTISDNRYSLFASPYSEYLATSDRASFADSIGLGMPAMLLALFAFFYDRRGRWFCMGALVCALGATGQALGIHAAMMHVIPGLGLFRYSEKLIAPTSLLIALAAARGAEISLATSRRAATILTVLSGAAAAILFGGRAWLFANETRFLEQLLIWGRIHYRPPAVDMLLLLETSTLTAAELSVALGLVALLRAIKPRGAILSPALAAACCFAASMTSASDLLFTCNVEILRKPPKLAEELVRRAGPSEGRWRFFSTAVPSSSIWTDLRFGAAADEIDVLGPQLEARFHIEGAAPYFSLIEDAYLATMNLARPNFNKLFDVRFVFSTHAQMTAHDAAALGFEPLEENWLRTNPQRPRAFLVEHVFVPPPEGSYAVMSDPKFDAAQDALVQPEWRRAIGKVDGPGALGTANLHRPTPEQIDVEVSAESRRLLIVSEHFDPGWSATIDGERAPVVRGDILALAVPVPAGQHLVKLRFWPVGLTAGLWIAMAGLLSSLLAIFIARSKRQIPSSD